MLFLRVAPSFGEAELGPVADGVGTGSGDMSFISVGGGTFDLEAPGPVPSALSFLPKGKTARQGGVGESKEGSVECSAALLCFLSL